MKTLIFLNLIMIVYSLPVEDSNRQNVPEEIQHAVCKVDTRDIKASANATITRQLKGVCSSKDLEKKFERLENILLEELNQIKNILNNVGVTIPKLPSLKSTSEGAVDLLEEDYEDDEDYANEIIQKEENINLKTINPQIDLQPINIFERNTSNPIDDQIKRLNASTQTLSLGRVFYYYWRINGIKKILNLQDVPFNSPVFNFEGYQLYIKLIPHHFGSQYVNLELKGDVVNKYRFTIINQEDSTKDITSQMLARPKSYTITHTKIDNFISNNKLLIKLLLYLDM